VPRSFVDATERRRTADTHARRRATRNRKGGANASARCGAPGNSCRSAGRSANCSSNHNHYATSNSRPGCARGARAPNHRRYHCPVARRDSAR
jgi:hypothetical protein